MQKFKLTFRGLSTTVPDTKLPNLIHRYEALISGGFLQADASQLRCLERLQILLEDLHLYGGKLRRYEQERTFYDLKRQAAEEQIRLEDLKQQQNKNKTSGGSSWNLSELFSSFNTTKHESNSKQDLKLHNELEQRIVSLLGPAPRAPPAPRGVYLFGSVGSGKTMLADMLYDAADEILTLKRRRVHCNAALLELHHRMHALEKNKNSTTTFVAAEDHLGKNAKLARIAHRRLVRDRMMTPLEEYSKGIAAANAAIMLKAARELLGSRSKETSSSAAALLCFDEMQTTDPYNVAALKALTEAALHDGGTLVATSNRAPKELSPHGLHEAMFDHFVETLERGCDVVELSSPEDYRRRRIMKSTASKKDEENFYFWPLNESSAAQIAAAWNAVEDNNDSKTIDPAPLEVPVMFGRTFSVRKHCGSSAWFSFDDLCGKPLGPSDYIALASRFKTVFITDVPAMSMRVRDKARRFITLVDEIYNQRGRVVCTAAVELDELFTAAGAEADEEPLIDLEGLQFEGAVEGAKQDDWLQVTEKRMAALGGEEERFAFARAVSRLYEMQSKSYSS